MKRSWAAVLLAAAIGAVPAPAPAACVAGGPGQESCAGAAVVAGPIASVVNYATRLVVAPAGGPLTFVNADIDGHNVVSQATDPLRRGFWCTSLLYTGRACPLFWSPVTYTGTTQVFGLENVESFGEGMRTYRFYCEPHDGSMEGTLVFV